MSKNDRITVLLKDGTDVTLIARRDGATVVTDWEPHTGDLADDLHVREHARNGSILRVIYAPHDQVVAVIKDRVGDPEAIDRA